MSDGTTDTTGWLVEPVATIAGTEPAAGADGRFVIWPTEAEGVPRAGEDLIVFVDPHRAETVHAGKVTSGYDVVRAGGVFVATGDGTVNRLCREERSDPVPLSSLGL